jgi:hypothetical protein
VGQPRQAGGVSAAHAVHRVFRSLDLIRAEDYIEGSLPPPLKRSGKGHLFQQIHGKDPYMQIDECRKLGLGDGKYRLVTVA